MTGKATLQKIAERPKANYDPKEAKVLEFSPGPGSKRRSEIPNIPRIARTPETMPFRHLIGFIKKYFYTQ